VLADVYGLLCCHVAYWCWGGSATACHVACWWGPHVRSVWWWGPPGWGGPMVDCHVALTCWGGSSVCCHLACLLLVWTTHRWPCGSSGDVACDVVQSDLAICICLVMWLLMWTIGWLPRGISGTHLSDMWDPHGWGGPMGCWHVALKWPNEVLTRVTLSLFSDSVCICLRSPVCTQISLCPQVAPRVALIKYQPLIFPF
jgi:hypothetical protein